MPCGTIADGRATGGTRPDLRGLTAGGPRNGRPALGDQIGHSEKRMKIHVDFDRCASTGTCVQIAPDVFELRDDGYLYIINEQPDDALRDDLEEAVESCPTEAISILGS